jgi:predicted ABC-type ATPase
LGLPARNRTWEAAGHVLARGGIVGDVPNLIVIAGPNGAGKSTAAEVLLGDYLGIADFVNADSIARGLSRFGAESVAISAGKIMLQRIRELAAGETDFAFETTLASRTFAPWIAELRTRGYVFHLHFLWLPDAELCIHRVAGRVAQGGHAVPPDLVRRRYRSGLRNLIELYLPLADVWQVYNNSGPNRSLVVEGSAGHVSVVYDPDAWVRIREVARGQSNDAG